MKSISTQSQIDAEYSSSLEKLFPENLRRQEHLFCQKIFYFNVKGS